MILPLQMSAFKKILKLNSVIKRFKLKVIKQPFLPFYDRI